MKFYVAAHDRLLGSLVGGVITRAGHQCTSTWLNNEFLTTDKHTVEERMSIAFEDVEDVCRSDVLVLVAGADKYSGGKFVEAGIAMGRGIPVIVIGRRENMLLWHHSIMSVDTPEMAAKVISNIEKQAPAPLQISVPTTWGIFTLDGRFTNLVGENEEDAQLTGEDYFTKDFIVRPLYEQPAPAELSVGWQPPQDCDGKEQLAFEAWAIGERYDMHEHPLHYLFMDGKTNAARQGWKAALRYVRERFASAEVEG